MATPERPKANTAPPQTDLKAVLADIDIRLERANENENPIERFFKRDELLELRDLAQDEIAAETPQGKQG